MSKKVGVRAAVETGASTGVATTVLALLSASALASFGLVTANQLAPSPSERVRAGGESALLQPPADVVITPSSTGVGAGTSGTTRSPARTGADQPVLAFPILLTIPALQATLPLVGSVGSDRSTIVPAVSIPELGSGSTPVIVPAAIPVAPQTSVVVPAAIPVAPQTSVVVPAALPAAPQPSIVVQVTAASAFIPADAGNPASSASNGNGDGRYVGRDDHHGNRAKRGRDAQRDRDGEDDGRHASNDVRSFATSAPQAVSRPVVVDVVARTSDSKKRNKGERDERQRDKRTSDRVKNTDAGKSSERRRDGCTSVQPGRGHNTAGSQTSSVQDIVSGRDKPNKPNKTRGDRSDRRGRGVDKSRDNHADSRVISAAGNQTPIVDVPGDLSRGRDNRSSDSRGSDSRNSDSRSSDDRSSDDRSIDNRSSDDRNSDDRSHDDRRD